MCVLHILVICIAALKYDVQNSKDFGCGEASKWRRQKGSVWAEHNYPDCKKVFNNWLQYVCAFTFLSHIYVAPKTLLDICIYCSMCMKYFASYL